MVRYSHTGQTSFGPLHQSRWTTPYSSARSSASRVRAVACRTAVLPFDQHGTMGDRSGEYGGGAPRRPMALNGRASSPATLCEPKMSIRHHVARAQGGPRTCSTEALQHLPICGPVHGQAPRRGPGSDRAPIIVTWGTIGLRDRIDAAFPSRRPATHACHRALEPRLGNALVARDGEGRPPAVIGSPCLRDARRGARPRGTPLFFRGSPRPWRARHIVGTLRRRPCVSATWAQRAAQVMSGVAPTAARRLLSAAAASRRLGPPAGAFGATAPVRRWRRRGLATNDTLPPNRAARVRGEPRCRGEVWPIFGRTSVEEAGMEEDYCTRA